MVIFKKRGSLELSITAIVIVVLAMTLLGLGLGFIRNMFTDISGVTKDISDQVREKILDDLITGDKKVSFPKTQIELDKGGADLLTIGIRNEKDIDIHYYIEFILVDGPQLYDIENPAWFQYAPKRGRDEAATLAPADSHVRNIRVKVPNIDSGSYFMKFNVIDDDLPPGENIYETKDFFLVVRG